MSGDSDSEWDALVHQYWQSTSAEQLTVDARITRLTHQSPTPESQGDDEEEKEGWSWNGDMAELRKRLAEPVASFRYDAAAFNSILQPLLLSSNDCARLHLDATLPLPGHRASLLRFALSLCRQSVEVDLGAADESQRRMLRHIAANVTARGFNLAADPVVLIVATDWVTRRSRSKQHTAQQSELELDCAVDMLAIIATLAAHSAFESSMLLQQAPTAHEPNRLALLLSYVAEHLEQKPESSEAERLLSLLQSKCAAAFWQFDSTDETPLHGLVRANHIGVLLRLLLATPSLSAIPLSQVGSASSKQVWMHPGPRALIDAWSSMRQAKRQPPPPLDTSHRLCRGVMEAIMEWQAAHGNSAAQAAMQRGSEKEQQQRRQRIIDACGEGVESLSEPDLRARIVALYHTLPLRLSAQALVTRLRGCCQFADPTPLSAQRSPPTFDHATCHAAISQLLATFDGADLSEGWINLAQPMLLRCLLCVPAHELERLSPLEPLLMRTMRGQGDCNWLLSVFIFAHSVPQRDDGFAWRFWHRLLSLQSPLTDQAILLTRLHGVFEHLCDMAAERVRLSRDAATGQTNGPSDSESTDSCSAAPTQSATVVVNCCASADSLQLEHIVRLVELICDSLDQRMHMRRSVLSQWHLALVNRVPIGDQSALTPLRHLWIERHPTSDLFSLCDANGEDGSLLACCQRAIGWIERLQQHGITLSQAQEQQLEGLRQLQSTLHARRDQLRSTVRSSLDSSLISDVIGLVLDYCAPLPPASPA